MAARKVGTRCWTGSLRPPRATTGHMASPLSRLSAASCWPVRRQPSSRPGWTHSGGWWSGPCYHRSMQVSAGQQVSTVSGQVVQAAHPGPEPRSPYPVSHSGSSLQAQAVAGTRRRMEWGADGAPRTVQRSLVLAQLTSDPTMLPLPPPPPHHSISDQTLAASNQGLGLQNLSTTPRLSYLLSIWGPTANLSQHHGLRAQANPTVPETSSGGQGLLFRQSVPLESPSPSTAASQALSTGLTS